MEIDFQNIEVSKESEQLANKAYPDDKYLASNAAYWIEIGRILQREIIGYPHPPADVDKSDIIV